MTRVRDRVDVKVRLGLRVMVMGRIRDRVNVKVTVTGCNSG